MKKSGAFLCALVLALLAVTPAAAAPFPDVGGHWAAAAVERWSGYGTVVGLPDGTFGPDNPITRGEMAAILCRVFGWQEQAGNTFADLSEDTWCTEYILKANAAGVILGDGVLVRPYDSITRQEAAVMLYRALYLEAEQEGVPAFPDSAQIAGWAAEQVETMAAKGYILGGDDGSFWPMAYVTRAQVLAILDRAVPAYYSRAGAYTGGGTGTVIVGAPGVTLQNMKVEGDLILTPAAAGSETTLYNVQVTGRLIVLGKELQTVNLTGGSSVEQLWMQGDKTLVDAAQSARLGGVFMNASGARITGIPVGTPVLVAETAEGAYVNGHLHQAGTRGTAQAGTDVTIGVEIKVEIDDGGQGDQEAQKLEKPVVLAHGEDSVTVLVQKGLKYVLTDAAGQETASFEAEADGSYTFEGLAWGHYYLTAERQGCQSSDPVSVYVSDGSLIIDWSESD